MYIGIDDSGNRELRQNSVGCFGVCCYCTIPVAHLVQSRASHTKILFSQFRAASFKDGGVETLVQQARLGEGGKDRPLVAWWRKD